MNFKTMANSIMTKIDRQLKIVRKKQSKKKMRTKLSMKMKSMMQVDFEEYRSKFNLEKAQELKLFELQDAEKNLQKFFPEICMSFRDIQRGRKLPPSTIHRLIKSGKIDQFNIFVNLFVKNQEMIEQDVKNIKNKRENTPKQLMPRLL